MVEFSESERAWHREMRSLQTDTEGREVLVGLDADETDFYVLYARRRGSGGRSSSVDGARYLALHEKHEKARLAVLAAEIQLRNENPPRQ